MALLDVEDIHAGYGTMEILKGVSLRVEAGQVVSIIGKEIFRIIEDLRRLGQTILMVEQNAAKALEISDYAYVLELGLNRFEGSGEGIRNDERIRRLYLGR